MAKKNHNKLYVIAFLFIILSSGFPVLSFPFPNLTNEGTNIFGWIFLNDRWIYADDFKPTIQTVEVSPTEFFSLQYASATEHDVNATTPHDPIDDVVMGRQEFTNTVQVGERLFKTSYGTTPYILNNEGEYMERLVHSDVNGTGFESGLFSYYFDNQSCGMSVFDTGRIIEFENPIIKYNGWAIKAALNGTDDWIDMPVTFEDCVVTVTDDDTMTQIVSVKNDTQGIFTEQIDIPKPIGSMKTTLTYLNNDPAMNNTHKFAFTNVLDDVPDHIQFKLSENEQWENGTINVPRYFLYTSSPNTVPIDFQNNANYTVFINNTENVNRTQLYQQNSTIFADGFAMWYYNEEKNKLVPLIYKFVSDSLDKLWNIKLVRDTIQPRQNHVYIDYMNNATVLPTGGIVTLDPTVATIFPDNIKHVTTSSGGVSNECQGNPPSGFDSDFAWQTISFVNKLSINTCERPIVTFDITAIPDEASVLQIDYQYNITSGFIIPNFSTGGGGFPNPNTDPDRFRVRTALAFGGASVFSEDVRPLNNQDAASTIFECTVAPARPSCNNVAENIDVQTTGNMIYSSTASTLNFDPRVVTFVTMGSRIDPDAVTNQVELVLESGKNVLMITNCDQMEVSQKGLDGSDSDCDNSGFYGQTSASTFSWTGDPASIQLEITFEIFGLASQPLNITCVNTVGDNFVDWDAPLDTGGTSIIGYQIERNSGAGFGILVADSGSGITNFNDVGVTAGISFTYRITAINDSGLGAVSTASNGCGVPEVSSSPVGLVASNIALGIVALDWQEATFDGNTSPTGFVIERTSGSPTSQSDTWSFLGHDVDPFAGANGQPVVPTSGTDSVFFNNPSISSRKTMYYFFQSFDRDEINGRPLFVDWAGTVSGVSGHFYHIQLLDGEYSRFSNTDFAINACGVGGLGASGIRLCIPFKGIGLIHNFERIINPPTSFSLLEEPFGVGFLMDTTSAFDSSGKVTLFIRMTDSSFTAGGNGGTMTIRSIEIEGMEKWDFGSSPIADTIIDEAPLLTCAGGINNCGTATAGNTEGTNQGFVRLVRDTGSLLTEFLDNTVTQLTNFGYRVSQINSEGTSDPSLVATIFTIGLPDPPINLQVTPTGITTIDVTWDDGSLGGGTVQFYTLERKTGVGGIFTTVSIDVNRTFNDFFLSGSTEFCYRVKVTTNAGESPFTNEVCGTTFDAPSPPQNLIATATSGSTINVQWDTPASDGGATITGYKIERQKAANPFEILFAERQPESNKILNDTNLEIGTLFTYRVRAVNQFGEGDIATASATTDPTPQAPQNFFCSPASGSAILLSWTTPLTFSASTGYQIDRKVVGGVFSTIVADTGTTATTFLNVGLALDSVFVYRVLGKTAEGDTDFTPEITCSSLSAPDFPPENVRGDFSEVVPHQTVLAWNIPDTFGIPITEFRIERDDGVGYSTIASVSGSSIAFVDQALDNDVNQRYRVITIGTEGESVNSIAVPFDANQTSHWHYENTIDDTGFNKNTGTVFGTPNFNGTGHIGKGFIFDSTRLEVDSAQESDYDFDRLTSFGITSYYRGNNATGSDQVIVSKSQTLTDIGYKFYIDQTGKTSIKLTNTATTNEIFVQASANVTDNTLHFIGFGYNGNGTASGISINIDGSSVTPTIITDNLSASILNNNPLTIGGTSTGTDLLLNATLDETRIFGSGSLDDNQLDEVAEDKLNTTAPINGTMTITGSTFANISGEIVVINLTSGFPVPTIGSITLDNFTATQVNAVVPVGTIDPITGLFVFDRFFNIMGSLSNYTADTTLTNALEAFPLLSNFDIQSPVFTFTGDFFFQQQRNPTFDVLSFNFTQTDIPFDLTCNLKSTLFGNGTTFVFTNTFFIQELFVVEPALDVVVACIDPNKPPIDPTAPSFGGSNALLSFVSFGDTTGIGNFLNFTENFGDFFGAGLPFLFIIILAAAFTGRSAPTGIIIIGVALGVMWFLGIIEQDPIMWGIIVVLIVLGALAGKKFL